MFQLRMKKNYLAIALIIVSIVILTVACESKPNNSSANYSPGEALAMVNGEPITQEDLYKILLEKNGEAMLTALINDRIREIEVKKQNITVSNEEIEKALASLLTQYRGNEDYLNEVLESYNMTMADLRLNAKYNIEFKKIIEKDITVTESEMKSYFEFEKEAFTQPEQVKVRHILVNSEAKAKEVKEKLSEGADFAALAKEYSIDEANNNTGGELGFIYSWDVAPEFADVAFSMAIGEISDPVKSSYGYHIINLLDRKEEKVANYEDSKDAIRESLLEQKTQADYDNWLERKYIEYNVENFLKK